MVPYNAIALMGTKLPLLKHRATSKQEYFKCATHNIYGEVCPVKCKKHTCKRTGLSIYFISEDHLGDVTHCPQIAGSPTTACPFWLILPQTTWLRRQDKVNKYPVSGVVKSCQKERIKLLTKIHSLSMRFYNLRHGGQGCLGVYRNQDTSGIPA